MHDAPPPHPSSHTRSPLTQPRSWNFRRFFLRGLAIVLPTALTITLVLFAYNFVDQRIGGPINAGLREIVLRATSFPVAEEEDFAEAYDQLDAEAHGIDTGGATTVGGNIPLVIRWVD